MNDDSGQERSASTVHELLLEATRALLWIESAADARRVAVETVTALGGQIVPVRGAGRDAIPADLSFGEGEPLLASAPEGSESRRLLERHLPTLLLDIRRAVEVGSQAGRLADDASIDSLTRLPNRRMLGRALGRLRTGDVVIMIDLDHFKRVNDTLGHDAGDLVLKALGATLLANVRERDSAGRFGGEEFVIILRDDSDADSFLERLRAEWHQVRPHPLNFSAGIARVREGGAHALRAADRAFYRAKHTGRNRSVWATDDDFTDAVERPEGAELGEPRPAFVAFSELKVPEGGQEPLEEAFQARLGRSTAGRASNISKSGPTLPAPLTTRWSRGGTRPKHFGNTCSRPTIVGPTNGLRSTNIGRVPSSSAASGWSPDEFRRIQWARRPLLGPGSRR